MRVTGISLYFFITLNSKHSEDKISTDLRDYHGMGIEKENSSEMAMAKLQIYSFDLLPDTKAKFI